MLIKTMLYNQALVTSRSVFKADALGQSEIEIVFDVSQFHNDDVHIPVAIAGCLDKQIGSSSGFIRLADVPDQLQPAEYPHDDPIGFYRLCPNVRQKMVNRCRSQIRER